MSIKYFIDKDLPYRSVNTPTHGARHIHGAHQNHMDHVGYLLVCEGHILVDDGYIIIWTVVEMILHLSHDVDENRRRHCWGEKKE